MSHSQEDIDRLESVQEEEEEPANSNLNDSNNNDNNYGDSTPENKQLSVEELLYSAASYHAIVKPVTLTMVLASLAVIFINTEETLQQGQEQLANTYTVFDTSDSTSSSTTLGLSLVNALIIVSVVCAMTFLIVFLYKFKCFKVLMAYMVLASGTLLGVLGGTMFTVAIDKYRLTIDKISFYATMWNFALVGTVCVFFGRGVPVYATQGYLIATSVILAWQLAHFDPWTSWTLLVMLALYDLCAVLTPCGPLKWLVKLMTKEGSAGIMPGLLYEAQLPDHARRPTRTQPPQINGNNNNQESTVGEETLSEHSPRTRRRRLARRSDTEVTVEESSVATTVRSDSGLGSSTAMGVENSAPRSTHVAENSVIVTAEHDVPDVSPATSSLSGGVDEQGFPLPPPPQEETVDNDDSNSNTSPATMDDNNDRPTAMIPLAIAKLYKLRLVIPVQPGREQDEQLAEQEAQDSSPNALLARLYTPDQLRSNVEAVFPRNGGRIDCEFPSSQAGNDGLPRYVVRDRHGVIRRRLFVGEDGKVFEERPQEENESPKDNTIKLGLGDFIFYSILVATAALYSFTTFAACILVVLAGLGSTLVLLAVYHHALPALPISILLGVIFYLLTRASIEPWIQRIFIKAYYV